MIAIESRQTIVEFFICCAPRQRGVQRRASWPASVRPDPMNDDSLLSELSIMNQNG